MTLSILLFSTLLGLASAASDPTPAPCTIKSPITNNFFDLNPIHIQLLNTSNTKKIPAAEGLARDHSWNATGYDVGYNFTLNFCGAVVEKLDEVVGVDKSEYGNISAFYRQGGKVYSIGKQNSVPVLRGRKLVLNYTDGSPCEEPKSRKRRSVAGITEGGEEFLDALELIGDDGKKKGSKGHDGDDDDDGDKKHDTTKRRKSTVISLLCDKEPLSPLMTLNFVGPSPDECTYFFEARTSAACPVVEAAKQTLSPSGVFAVIAIIAIAVYIVGGCAYSRMVLNQRGWRQLPNYALWSSIFAFFHDIFVILTSSCARFLPGRRGYNRLDSTNSGFSRSRGRADSDAENRLIDDLNEEWED